MSLQEVEKIDLPCGTIIVIDDENEAINEFREALKKFNMVQVEGYTRFDDKCQAAILRRDIAGVSLDWILYFVDKGPDIIRHVKINAPNVATLVRSRFSEKKEQAFLYGADNFRIRSAGEGLVEDVAKTLRLTYFRRIQARINSLANTFPVFQNNQWGSDSELLFQAQQLMFNSLNERGMVDNELQWLLVQRGWWRRFDIENYSNMDLVEKAKHLASWLKLDWAVFAQCLDKRTTPEQAFGPIHEFVALIGYGLRLVQYEAELLPMLFENTNILSRRVPKSPWKELGLNEYIKRMKTEGIHEAYKWLLEI